MGGWVRVVVLYLPGAAKGLLVYLTAYTGICSRKAGPPLPELVIETCISFCYWNKDNFYSGQLVPSWLLLCVAPWGVLVLVLGGFLDVLHPFKGGTTPTHPVCLVGAWCYRSRGATGGAVLVFWGGPALRHPG